MNAFPSHSTLNTAAVAVLTLTLTPWAAGQSLSERIDDHLHREASAARRAATAPADEGDKPFVAAERSRSVARRMGDLVRGIDIQDATAKQALDWWRDTTDIPLVVNWKALEFDGITGDTPINLRLEAVSAGQLLSLLMEQASPDTELIYTVTPWYVRVDTKAEANKRTVMRMYSIADLIIDVPQFTDAPTFDLAATLNGANRNGGEGGGRGGRGGDFGGASPLGGRDASQPDPTQLSREQRAQQIIDLIYSAVEPDVWEINGGSSSISYFRDYLIIRAPLYVHAKIGTPAPMRLPDSER